MRIDNLKSLWLLFFLITVLGAFIDLVGCSSDDFLDLDFSEGWQWPDQTETLAFDVGPEGGVIEVTDPGSSIHGFKIEIPEGALAETTTITVTRGADAPSLPAGLESGYNPVIELTADAPFLKEIQITFPILDLPENSEKLLSAFYWDTAEAKWQVVVPESIASNSMIIQTPHFSYWRWGEVILDEVETETLDPLYDWMYGPDFFDELKAEIENVFNQLNFLNYCDNQQEIYDFFLETKKNAKDSVGEALTAISSVCNVCGLTPNDFLSVGISEIIEINWQYYVFDALLGFGPSNVYEILQDIGVVGKHPLDMWYDSRMENLSCDYPCIFKNSDFTLWGNMGLYYGADAAMLVMQLAEIEYPCN